MGEWTLGYNSNASDERTNRGGDLRYTHYATYAWTLGVEGDYWRGFRIALYLK